MEITVRVIEEEGRLFIVKEAASDSDRERLAREARQLAAAAHPGVVSVESVSRDGSTLRLHHGGTPVSQLHGMAPAQAAGFVAAAADVVADLHAVGIAHGRLSGSHLLADRRGSPVLCGFGESEAANADSTAADVHGLGCLLEELLVIEAGGGRSGEGVGSRRSAEARTRRALRAVADQATAAEPTRRPSARQLSDLIARSVDGLALPARDDRTDAVPADADRDVPAEPDPPVHDLHGVVHAWRPALVLGALLLLGGLVGVVIARLALDRTDEPETATRVEPAPASSTAPAPTSRSGARPGADLGAAGGADRASDAAKPTTEATCPPTAPTATDRDGDGCADPVRVEGRTVIVGDERFVVGQEEDVVGMGDWDCDGVVTPVALRPSSGELFVFGRWPTGEPVEVRSTAVVEDAEGLEVRDDGPCDAVALIGPDGDAVGVWEDESR